MKPKEVLNYYKSRYNFRKLTGMSCSTLSNWLKKGYVEKNSQYKLEIITKGALKSEWTKENK